MKTYNTLRMAFAKGKGDHIYTKDGQFICISKNDEETAAQLIKEGFIFMKYEDVLKQAYTETEPQAPKVIRTIKAKPVNETVKKQTFKYMFTSPDIYDFSDADPGL
jgi:hypothetical protein